MVRFTYILIITSLSSCGYALTHITKTHSVIKDNKGVITQTIDTDAINQDAGQMPVMPLVQVPH